MTTLNMSALDKMLEPVAQCLTTDSAKALVKLRADPETRARIEELATKSTAGKLTAPERAEYETYVTAIDFLSILQSKARSVLAKARRR